MSIVQRRVVHVPVVGGDVQVPAQHDLVDRRVEALGQEDLEAGQPRQLLLVLGGVERAAVGHVGADDVDPAAAHGQQAGLAVEAGILEPGPDVVDPDPAGDGHPVPPSLTVGDDVIAPRREVHRRKGVVGALGLLQAEDVGLELRDPGLRPGEVGQPRELTFQVASRTTRTVPVTADHDRRRARHRAALPWNGGRAAPAGRGEFSPRTAEDPPTGSARRRAEPGRTLRTGLSAVDAVLWRDYLCPWCYLGRDRTALLIDLGVTVTARAFELHPEVRPEGRPVRSDGRFAAVLDHIAQQCAEVGLPFRAPTRIANTRTALETIELVGSMAPEAFAAVDAAFYEAQWVQDRDLGDPAVIDGILGDLGVDATEVASARADGDGTRALDAAMAEARARDVTGTPAWWVADRLLIPGVQERDTLERWIRRLAAT